MIIKTANYIKSSSQWKQCPNTKMPEYAFIGRSNVGKSSFINMLTINNKLAKTSSKPGKTQLINHFLINGNWYLVDLPGYGYAHKAKTLRIQWSNMTVEYIAKRENLVCVCVLIDSRLAPQKIDLAFINMLGEKQIPFVLIFTKVDKQSNMRTERNIEAFFNSMSEEWEELPLYFVSSSVTGKGRKEFLDFVDKTNKTFSESH